MLSLRNYEELSIIGRGAYGTVFKARDTENDRTVALKQVRVLNTSEEKGVPISTLREITLLKQLDNLSHPNIVRMFDAFQTYSTSSRDSSAELILTIVFEHVEQDLSHFLFNIPPPGLPEPLIKNLMHQLLCGVDYLHVNRLVHRDIKPQNILITKNKQVKIADFGLARVYDYNKLVTSIVVTLWYRAPEILLQQPYTTLVDLWSVGTILVEMYNQRPLFPGKGDIDQLHKILAVIGCPTKVEWPEESTLSWDTFKNYDVIRFDSIAPEMCSEGVDLLKHLLIFNPEKRFNAHACLAHPYFDDVELFNQNNNPIKRDRQSRQISANVPESAKQRSHAAKNNHKHSPCSPENVKRQRLSDSSCLTNGNHSKNIENNSVTEKTDCLTNAGNVPYKPEENTENEQNRSNVLAVNHALHSG